MNLSIIQKEIKSAALNEVIKSLVGTVDEMKARTIDYQQANCEIVGCKHIIQSIALDWAYNGRINTIKTITK